MKFVLYYLYLRWTKKERLKRLGSKLALCYTEYVPWVAVELKLVKDFIRNNMSEEDIKTILYGSIRELTQNRKYFYDSSYRPHWTEEGKKVVGEMLDMYAEKINIAIKQADEQRAKDIVFNTLKQENN